MRSRNPSILGHRLSAVNAEFLQTDTLTPFPSLFLKNPYPPPPASLSPSFLDIARHKSTIHNTNHALLYVGSVKRALQRLTLNLKCKASNIRAQKESQGYDAGFF
jgi:hypothetical protein